MKSNVGHRGFTLIELVAVISVLSILASIAVVVYREYRKSQYDAEALANLTDLYAQASRLVSAWGISENASNTHAITKGCLGFNPANLADNATAQFNSAAANWSKYRLTLMDGPQHWSYNVCFSYLDSTVGGESGIEGFLISASRLDGDSERVILYGTGIQTPIVDAKDIPTGATLNNVAKTDLFRKATVTPSEPSEPTPPAEGG